MKNRLLYNFILLLFISCGSVKEKQEITSLERPNILFISIDDLNNWSGFLKNFPNVHTPNIDRLSSEGLTFTNAHCQAPICAPSRASLFSGLYPHSTGLYYQFTDEDIKTASPANEVNILLPDYLEKYGYKTLGVGKIFHNGDRVSVFDKYGGVFPEMQFGPKPEKRINYNPEWFSDTRRTATDWGPIDMKDSDMSDYKIAEWATNQLTLEHSKPFFMAVGFVRPHVPWHVPKKWFDLIDKNKIELPPYLASDFDDIPKISKKLHEMPAMPNTDWLIKEDKWKDMVKSYLACMAFVDAQVGKVLEKLENSQYKENTIIVLWSDHGYHLGEKGRTAKHSLWERATHVPLIFSGRGIKRGYTINNPVGLIDLYPTLLDISGLPVNVQNEGNSLMPLINDANAEWDNVAITSYGYKNISLYKGDFHYIQYRNGDGELYDLKEDPNEWNNRFSDGDYVDRIKDFKKYLPEIHAPLSPVNRINVNKYIDDELREFGINNPLKKH